jgi:hypothetical protein
MAYKKIVQGRSYPHMYNVTMTVGSRKALYETAGGGTKYTSSYEPNVRDDVMLVQYLLKRVYQGWQSRGELNESNSGPTELKIDGMHGPKTQQAIEQFQLEVARTGRSIATDGCVDTEAGDTQYSSISKTGYTISWLNSTLWALNPALAQDITLDPECPAELRQSVGNNGWA